MWDQIFMEVNFQKLSELRNFSYPNLDQAATTLIQVKFDLDLLDFLKNQENCFSIYEQIRQAQLLMKLGCLEKSMGLDM